MIDKLLQYLKDSASAGQSKAEVLSVHQMADGVFRVYDSYDGEVEIDIYFDLSLATPVYPTPGASGHALRPLGMGCIGLGPFCPMDIASVVCKKLVTPKDGWWPEERCVFSKASGKT